MIGPVRFGIRSAILVGIVYLLYCLTWSNPGWESGQRKKGVTALLAVRSADDRVAAVGRLGLTQTYADGTWIAIFYADSHGATIQSLAIARDSEDNWFESTDHYCAAFSVAKQRQSAERLLGRTQPQGRARDIDAILGARTIADTHKRLRAIGFRRITPP